MWEWAGNKPQRCLKVGVDAAAWVETELNWRGRRRYRCVVSPLQEGLVKPSPAEDNLSDIPALQGRIRSLTGSGSESHRRDQSMLSDLPRRITLLLPDAAARTMVLQLDQLPADREECEALIRWRLGQEQLFSLAGAKLVWRVFPAVLGPRGRAHTVLAVAIQESVLQQYESLCESIGLIPHEVGITSLRLFNLWRKVAGRLSRRKADFLWATVADRALTTMVFQQGRLLFYRCKLLGGEPATSVATADQLDKVIEECGASLELCQQRHPDLAVTHAVLCGDGEVAALKTRLETSLGLSIEQMDWGVIDALGLAARGSQRGIASLAAMAGI
jgi:hypothetical protein